MRLTLRTMLAYLDDILEPADFQDISKKIAESEFATNLVHRTRDVTRRLRLGAPKLSGRGMGLDPNTVAEYLDNTLAADRVPDFEKVCLESDVHLAEVTACHQILTLVLGEPAHVDPGLRRRLYHVGTDAPHLAEAAHEAHVPAPHAEHHAPPPPLPMVPIRERPVVPDYLRESTKSRWRTGILSAVAAAVVLGAIVMAVGGPKDVLRMIGVGETKKIQLPETTFTESAPAMSAPTDMAVAPANEPPQNPPAADAMPQAILPPANIAPPANIETPAAASTTDAPQPELRQPIASSLPDGPPMVVDSTPPPAMPPETTVGTAPATTIPPAVAAPVNNVPPTPAAAFVIGDNEAVARVVSDEDVLLRFDPSANAWRRLASRALLSRGDKLLALPTFRPTILLSSNLHVQIVPETLIEVEGPDAGGVLGISVPYGRIVIVGGNAEIRLRLGEQQGKLVLGNGEAIVAAEVRRFRLTGVNPEAQPSPAAVDLYCTSDQATWSEASGGEPRTLKSPGRLVIVPHPGEVMEGVKELPKWIASNQVTPLDERASRTFYKVLDDQNVLMKLKELAVDKRAENRSLAIRSLAHLGQFEEFVDVLNDPDQYSAWAPYTESVEAALARGPDAAGKVRAAFERKAGDKGAELYRMMWGYSPSDLEGGAAVTLVENLDHEDLPLRVLAFWNLKNITGSTLTYRPEAPPVVRRQAVQRWRDRLREGQIITKPPVAPKKPAGGTDAPPG